MNIPIYQVDAFTIKPFTGNPAAVCLLEKTKADTWMQNVASEMNLSETAFLVPKRDGYHLRWFTPTTEVELCGHATLASAHILYEFGFYEEDETIEFYTLSGTLTASYNNAIISLDMPRREAALIEPPSVLTDVLGVAPITTAIFEDKLILAEFENEDQVRSFLPNFKRIAELPQHEVVITAKAEAGKYDFVSRFFAPKMGINEDPVTGSAHCFLGPYWSAKLGKEQFIAYQASPRGGEVCVRLEKDRAFIGGKAVTVLQGELVHQ